MKKNRNVHRTHWRCAAGLVQPQKKLLRMSRMTRILNMEIFLFWRRSCGAQRRDTEGGLRPRLAHENADDGGRMELIGNLRRMGKDAINRVSWLGPCWLYGRN